MIIVRSPLRISLSGGGSDFRDFYKKNFAGVLSFSFNKYVNIFIKKSFNGYYILNYSKKEKQVSINKIKHPIFREVLKYFGVREPVEITSVSDFPSKGSGLGSSSSFTCALVAAVSLYLNKKLSKKKIAKIASYIEIKRCKSNIGIQDHYACAVGGFNFLTFKKNNEVKIESLNKYKKKILKTINNFYLVPTNIYRKANKILRKQQSSSNVKNKEIQIKKLVSIAMEMKKKITKGKSISKLLNKSWEIKKKISNNISNKTIDKLFNKGMDAGANAGKLLGAGGGGFLLFYVPIKKKKIFIKKFKNKYFKINIDYKGIQILKKFDE